MQGLVLFVVLRVGVERQRPHDPVLQPGQNQGECHQTEPDHDGGEHEGLRQRIRHRIGTQPTVGAEQHGRGSPPSPHRENRQIDAVAE
jgi:hypothetical protein